MDAARTFTAAHIDPGEKPAVASAIVKYHVTELAEKLAMMVWIFMVEKEFVLGPKNYIRPWL